MKIVSLGKEVKFYKDICHNCKSEFVFCEYEVNGNSCSKHWECPICKSKNYLFESEKDNATLQISQREYVDIEEDLTLRLMIK